MKKIYLTVLIILMIVLGGAGGYFVFKNNNPLNASPIQISSNETSKNVQGITQTPIPSLSPSPNPQVVIVKPAKMEIPKINVSTSVESVGMDKQGRMDVPSKWQNVGWYNLGYKVGQNGNAVIDGHYDRQDGSPAVFYEVNKLKAGDKIIVTGDDQKKLTYKVTNIRTFDHDQVPLKEIFGPSVSPKLNLITCGGVWNERTKNYEKRIVVYSELES